MHTISQRLTAFEAAFGRIGAGYFRDLVRAAASRTFGTLLLWQERAGQRHRLAALDGRLLTDMGLTRADALREAGKRFWQA